MSVPGRGSAPGLIQMSSIPDINNRESLGLTFIDLLVEASYIAGNTTYFLNGATKQIDSSAPAGQIVRMKDIVNRAVRTVMGEKTPWTSLEQTATITLTTDGAGPFNIDRDPQRYRLPGAVRGIPRATTLAVLTGNTRAIEVIQIEDWIRLMQRDSSTPTGRVLYAAFQRRSMNPAGGGHERPGFEMRVYPSPDAADVVTVPYEAAPAALVDEQDRAYFGPDLDDMLLRRVQFEAAMTYKPVDAAMYRQNYEEAKQAALANDARMRPAIAGRLSPQSPNPLRTTNHADYPRTGTITIDGVTVKE